MSVTNVGASPHPTAPPPWSSQSGEWQAGKPNVLKSTTNNVADNAANRVTDNLTGNGVTGKGVNSATTGGAKNAATRDANADANPLPPVQAATAPGTGQKVNIIA